MLAMDPTHFQHEKNASPVPDARPNILIVDDRQENLLATEKVLKSLDAKIFTASSGNQALSLMLRHEFAVMLLDVQMPEMDGFEVAMLMQEQEMMKNIPIIFVTAISKEEKYATQAAEIGAVDYIFKPINSDILRSKVKVYLDLYVQHQQILRLNQTLMQSNTELERFAYICSHDLQEPVRMMNSYSELLNEDYGSTMDDDAKRYMKLIRTNAMRMQKMIMDILAFSRVGREEIQFEDVDCNQILADVLAEFEETIKKTNAQLHYSILPTIHTSPTLLRILFQNLISNALKFRRKDSAPDIRITSEQRDNLWHISIQDNGTGMDPQFHYKIFSIFQRLHRKEEFAGTGIGLATCKKFIELCGGNITFESSLETGSTFHFTLPVDAKGV